MASNVKSNKSGKKQQQQQGLLIVGAVIGIAVIVAFGAILLSGQASVDAERYADIPSSRLDDGAFVLGEPDAPFTLVEFQDFACPACQSYKPTVERYIDEFVATGQANLEYRTLVTAGGATTAFAADLAECADEQEDGLFWPAHDLLYVYAQTGRYNVDMATQFADDLSIDRAQLLNCTRTASQVETDERLAASLGASSTPSVFYRINGGNPRPLNSRDFNTIAQLVASAQPSS